MADKKISALTGATTPLVGTEVLPIVQSGSTVKVSIADVTAGRDVTMQSLDVSLPFYDPNGRPRVRVTSSSVDPVLEWDRWSGVGTNFNGARFIYDGTTFAFGNAPVGSVGSLTFTNRMEINATGDVKANTGNLIVGTAGKGIDFSANANAPGMTSELLNDYEEGTWTPAFAAWTTAPSVIAATYTKIGRQVTVTLYANDGVNAGGQDITGLPFAASASSAGAAFGSSSTITTVIRGSVLPSASAINNFPTNNLTGQYWQIVAVYFV